MKSDACSGMNNRIAALEGGGSKNYEIISYTGNGGDEITLSFSISVRYIMEIGCTYPAMIKSTFGIQSYSVNPPQTGCMIFIDLMNGSYVNKDYLYGAKLEVSRSVVTITTNGQFSITTSNNNKSIKLKQVSSPGSSLYNYSDNIYYWLGIA